MSAGNQKGLVRIVDNPNTPVPEVQLLSNGRYHVMLTGAGGGNSRWKNLAITRWCEDATRDNWGAFCYIRDLASGHLWSTSFQPTLQRADRYEAVFATGRVAFRRRDRDIETHTEIAVSPEDDVELRRVHITNGSPVRRAFDVTSYAEIVLALPATDAAHPAFSKLFVETELLHERHAILSTRRPRAPDEPTLWMFHLLTAPKSARGAISYETDRMRFIGRGRTTADPQALDDNAALSRTAGPVLDPVAAIRCGLTLDPGETAIVDLISGVSETREACVGLVARYQDRPMADRVLTAATTHEHMIPSRLQVSEADARLYAHLAGSVIYANALLRADPSVLGKNRRSQSSLWAYAISGDMPIVVLRIADSANMDLARQPVQAHAYWRLHGLAVDLVILREDRDGHQSVFQEQIVKLIAACGDTERIDQPGGIFVRPANKVSEEDGVLLQTVARVVISDVDGSLAQQLERRCATPASISPPAPERRSAAGIHMTTESSYRSPKHELNLLQRAWRVHCGWTRVRHLHCAWTDDACTVGKRVGEPDVRNPRFGERKRQYLERERAAVPTHAVVE